MKYTHLGVTAVWILLGLAARAADVPYAFSYAGKPAAWLDGAPAVRKIEETDRRVKTVREWGGFVTFDRAVEKFDYGFLQKIHRDILDAARAGAAGK